MMYLILRSTSTGLEPSFHTTQEGLTNATATASTVVFVSDFGQQKLFHLKPGSITYHWKALFLKEMNMPVK
jgi:hypothetical protein